MYTKSCPKCNRPSFSSSKIGKWICPICNYDLSNLRARHAGEAYPPIYFKKYSTSDQTNSPYQSTFEKYI